MTVSLHLDDGKHLVHAGADLCSRDVLHFQTKSDVLVNGHVGEEGIRLKHHAQVALAGRQAGDLSAIQKDLTGTWGFKTSHHTQGGGLATATGAEEGNEFPFFYRQINIFDDDIFIKRFG
ncbi:hypothetical protein SDC9_172484 [bioreactor metagenome]|uniref:Uncharacterized protein n=1 Tax=bioreactor metagenome TaxID=1076179 RepID=A0A645GDU6_9ZZZZ